MSRLVRRYSSLLRTELKISAALAMQYRLDFLLSGAKALFWLAITLVPLRVVYSQRAEVAVMYRGSIVEQKSRVAIFFDSKNAMTSRRVNGASRRTASSPTC